MAGAGYNSNVPFIGASPEELQEYIGITKFSGANADQWSQVIGGVIIQGGRVNAVPADGVTAVNFPAPYPSQVLGIFTQAIYSPGAGQEASGLVNAITLNSFELGNDAAQKDFYWWSIGI